MRTQTADNAARRPSQCVSGGIVLICSVIYSRVREIKQEKYQIYQSHSDKVGSAKGGGGGEGRKCPCQF